MRGRFYVYVVALKPRKAGRGKEVYVGSSALTPEERFYKHKHNPRSSRHVRRRGVRLLPRLYRHLNPLPSRENAKRTEQHLRRQLERRGYKVYGSCLPSPECFL
jgi:hypothetical protein